ncbi:MAG: ankyrin repeat domain-containing protein [Clostridia bacterium]|nr:ankyrin repeat domain-containing protein [Clostridia bacterium]
MKRKLFPIVVITLILIGVVLSIAVYRNSDNFYSKKLVSAIREEDIIEVKKILSKKPTCINAYPGIKWLDDTAEIRAFYPLNVACARNNVELITLLLENGADVNCNDGVTPLSMVYRMKADNWYEISLILIESGASLNYTTEYSGKCAGVFMDIVHDGYLPDPPEREGDDENVMAAFKYALANCDHSNIDWMNVLQHSVSNDRIEIVKLLLDGGYVNVNYSPYGMTALMFAARDSTAEMVQLLLDYGADKSLRDSDGETAYDYAVRFNNEDVVSILQS